MLKKLWNTITRLGVTDSLDASEARRVSYLNYFMLLSLMFLAVRILLSISNPAYALKLFGMSLLVIPVMVCNAYHYYTTAKLLAITIWVTGVSFFSYNYMGGFEHGTFMVLFTAVLWPFMLFSPAQKKYILLSLLYLFICFTTIIVLHYINPRPVTVDLNMDVVRISLTALTLAILLLISWYFFVSNVAAENTLRKEKERAEEVNVHLEKEIQEREQAQKELQVAKETAEAANKAKSAFLANMSHELRTPLNVILGFSELMKRDPQISPEQLKNLTTIGGSGEHLLSLINDVLEFSKIEAGQVEINEDSFDLHRLLVGLEDMFRLRAQQKGISLELHRDDNIPRFVSTDKKKLRQVLINLLGNAINHTHSGEITLSVSSENENDRDGRISLHFVVADTGVGISREEQEKIFHAFFQADGPDASKQGTGLGLPISKKFVELLGGELAVQSELDKGTTFSFTIKTKAASETDTEVADSGGKVIGLEEGQTGFRLLVVEDNENSRKLLTALLRTVGFEVETASNGIEGLEKWRRWRPHLIWMDMRMPVMDGYEATSRIKTEMGEKNTGPDTRIIAITASAFEEDRVKILEIGADDFVRKPYRETEIFEIMHKHLGVEYVFDKEEQDQMQPEIHLNNQASLKTEIKGLPDNIVDKLVTATELGDTDRISEAIDEIRALKSGLASALNDMADNFAYDQILALTRNISDDSDTSG